MREVKCLDCIALATTKDWMKERGEEEEHKISRASKAVPVNEAEAVDGSEQRTTTERTACTEYTDQT
jgi:hypothetical protein